MTVPRARALYFFATILFGVAAVWAFWLAWHEPDKWWFTLLWLMGALASSFAALSFWCVVADYDKPY